MSYALFDCYDWFRCPVKAVMWQLEIVPGRSRAIRHYRRRHRGEKLLVKSYADARMHKPFQCLFSGLIASVLMHV